MSHVDAILKHIGNARERAQIEHDLTHSLPEMGTLLLPSDVADKAFCHVQTAEFFARLEGRGPQPKYELLLGKRPGDEDHDFPVRVSYFVVNRVFNLPEIMPQPAFIDAPVDERYNLLKTEALNDRAQQLTDELQRSSINAGRYVHVVLDRRGQKVIEQSCIFVPHVRPVKLPSQEISTANNIAQLDEFVLQLASKGFIDLRTQEEDIERAFGICALMSAKRHFGLAKYSIDRPSQLDI
jgi:hypothetical protein